MTGATRLVLEQARSGRSTIRAESGGTVRWIHSPRDPEAEAKALVDEWWQGPGLYIVLGLGLGYHVAELEKRLRSTGGEILVLEPLQEIYDIASAAGTVESLARVPRVKIHAGVQARRALNAKNVVTGAKSVFLCIHPVLHTLFRDEYEEVLVSLRSEVNRQVVNARTLLFWDLQWLRNTIVNLPFLVDHPSGTHLQSRFAGIPAFIVSAGPSLDKNVRELRRAKGRGLIIAVGTALRSVLNAGVTPDLIVSVDASPKNYEHFRRVPADGIPLVFDPMVFPAILSDHRGPKIAVRTYNPVYEWLSSVLEQPLQLTAGGSVATAALDFAVKLGCNPIVLVGQDLSYDDVGRTHAADSVYGNDRASLDSPGLLRVPGNAGGEVWTSRSLYSFLVWFERYLEVAPSTLRVINATEGGARITGTEVQALAPTIDRECRTDINAGSIVAEAIMEWSPVTSVERVREFILEGADGLTQMARRAREGQEHVQELRRLIQRNRLRSRQAGKLLKKLANVNRSFRALQEDTQDVLHAALYRTILQVLRNDDDINVSSSHPGSYTPDAAIRLLERSERLYEAIDSACTRTVSVIRDSLPTDGQGRNCHVERPRVEQPDGPSSTLM